MNTRLAAQAVAAFNAGKIEQSSLLFWRAAHFATSYYSLHNYAVYLSDNALYIPIGGGKYAAIKKQPSILYYLTEKGASPCYHSALEKRSRAWQRLLFAAQAE